MKDGEHALLKQLLVIPSTVFNSLGVGIQYTLQCTFCCPFTKQLKEKNPQWY